MTVIQQLDITRFVLINTDQAKYKQAIEKDMFLHDIDNLCYIFDY